MGTILIAWTFCVTCLCGAAAAAVAPTTTLPLGYKFNGISNKVITPNGDGRNDNVAFRFDNPGDVAGSVKIYDARGHLVATLSIDPGDVKKVWDARTGGATVPTGVYIYVITVAGSTSSGAVAVIR